MDCPRAVHKKSLGIPRFFSVKGTVHGSLSLRDHTLTSEDSPAEGAAGLGRAEPLQELVAAIGDHPGWFVPRDFFAAFKSRILLFHFLIHTLSPYLTDRSRNKKTPRCIVLRQGPLHPV